VNFGQCKSVQVSEEDVWMPCGSLKLLFPDRGAKKHALYYSPEPCDDRMKHWVEECKQLEFDWKISRVLYTKLID
jgi:hypothetical protein